jgi:hypothetical protein
MKRPRQPRSGGWIGCDRALEQWDGSGGLLGFGQRSAEPFNASGLVGRRSRAAR